MERTTTATGARTPGLPIAVYRQKIIDAVLSHSVVVIEAETGAGKSTQVPQYLLAEGYDLVVTQPRRLAARSVAARVAEEMGVELGNLVGFRTAQERQDSPSTRCLFCTDGLALVRELMGQNKGILVLDEVHEWNENMEVLCAWAKAQAEAGASFKVVLMSATMEAEKLSAFFNGAPVISVPGRLYPVEERQPSRQLEDDVANLLNQGRNVLVFQPGKAEINATINALEVMKVNAEILPLHGQLTPEEQRRCFRHYGRPKVVVSTNVAQTSVTIDDVDAVVDSGLERRIELVDGVEGLYLKPISRADASQRKGRAGRCKPGIYIDHCGASTRPDFPVAEIMRKRLDQTVLRLAIAGFDMEAMEFFHQPAKSDIHDARRTLIGLGCMTADGNVTQIGKLVNRLPVSVQYARMLVEADRLGVVDDVLTVAAIMEMGGITAPPPSRNRPDRPDWRRMVPQESESDVMGQLAVWKMADSMSKDEMAKGGVSIRDYFRAKEIRKHLAKALERYFRFGSSGQRENILKAVCAGMVDHLYKGNYGRYRNGDDTERELGESSLVRGAEWLVGKPFDLQIKTRRGMMTLRLIEMASKVDPTWLTEVAPHLASQKTGLNPRYESTKDCVVSTTQTFFNGQMVREKVVTDPDHAEAPLIFARWLASQRSISDTSPNAGELNQVLQANTARQVQADQLNVRAGKDVFKVFSSTELHERFKAILSGARRLAEVFRPEALALPELDKDKVEAVVRDCPDTISTLDEELVVEYRRYGEPPRVKLSQEMIQSNTWINLPDESLRLPDGRVVEVVINLGWSANFSNVGLPQLKEQVRGHLNREQWDQWADRPVIAEPDPANPASQIPLTTVCYGKCVVMGEYLLAYGTLSPKSYRYNSSDPHFEIKWFQSKSEAEVAVKASADKLDELKAMAKAKTDVGKLKSLSSHDSWNELESGLRREVENWQYTSLPTSTEGLRQHQINTEVLITKVETGLAETVNRRESRATLAELQREHGWAEAFILVRENGEVLVNCGKRSKMGRFEVIPELRDRQYGPESLGSDGKRDVWQPIPIGRQIIATDYSGAGNINSQVSFVVPSGLPAGGWLVMEDGKTFCPAIYWNGGEVIPDIAEVVVSEKVHASSTPRSEKINVKVDEPAPADATPASSEDIADAMAVLRTKFGKK